MQIDEPLWTSAELGVSCGALTARPWYADRVQVRCEGMTPGTLYIALEGVDANGASGVPQALAKGAIAALVDTRLPDFGGVDDRLIHVVDTAETLRMMARHARNRAPATRIAMMGQGLDTDFGVALAAAFGLDAQTLDAETGLEPGLGTVLRLARLPRSAAYGLFSFDGADGRALAELVAPQVLLVFGAAAQAANAVLPALGKDTLLVIDVSEDAGRTLARQARAMDRRVLTVAVEGVASARGINLAEHAHCTCLSADIDGVPVTYKVGLPGQVWTRFSLMALTAVKAAGADLGRAALSLAGLGNRPIEDVTEETDWAESPVLPTGAFARRALAE